VTKGYYSVAGAGGESRIIWTRERASLAIRPTSKSGFADRLVPAHGLTVLSMETDGGREEVEIEAAGERESERERRYDRSSVSITERKQTTLGNRKMCVC